MKESDIVFESEDNIAFVYRNKSWDCYEVLRHSYSNTNSLTDSAYSLTEDGLSIAIARAKYLAKRYAIQTANKGL